ncbi:MAG: hypothetical protein ACXVPN_05700 [Bacteroidia bacterium]
MVKRLLLLCSAVALFGACSKLNPKIQVPSYLQVDSFQVVTAYSSQGTNNQKFSDLLIESKTYNYGYYPMPGKIPIPLTGATYLIVRPVIKVNGVGALRVDYPLMHGYDTTFGLIPGQPIKVTPVFKYYPTVNFRFMGDFEGGNQMKNSNAADTFGVEFATNATHPGSQMPGSGTCLLMKLDAAHQYVQTQSYTAFPLPNDGTNIFLEINYKSNTSFEVGLIGTNGLGGGLLDQRTVGGANASPTWNKMYFSFSDLTRTPPVYPYYYLYFYKSGYDPTSTTNEIYIDNIKVISQN